MATVIPVRVGVAWNTTFPPESGQTSIISCDAIAVGFHDHMTRRGHQGMFIRAREYLWETCFEHPDFGGDSLSFIDNVHIFYYCDHGENIDHMFVIPFTVQHPHYLSWSNTWKLGVQSLRWVVFDACQMVSSSGDDEIVPTWGRVVSGVRILLGFKGDSVSGPDVAGRGARFADLICDGRDFNDAWATAAFASGNCPAVIAWGATKAEAETRLHSETLAGGDRGPVASSWWACCYWS
jgi:hypothetical protein